ncbi:HNH endonuclease [Paeniglutamicibacter antarcticus]|uniref:HNH endonuclease n=1 Tax=Arthrobacter terrae TaxID=2935737 RepID=A0A931CP88_9MICC|nr:HNH endonuclease [Arthrobacter terrae]MBG0739009.1 HNH endonuclease [Arthrobacter terrae]
MDSVLVLNAGYEPMHRVSLKHAIGMVHRGVAEILKDDGDLFGPFARPVVLRLIRYVKMTWQTRPSCSKEAVKRRDGRCAYCTKGRAETVDHVIPQSRGGLNTWLNLVGCCFVCNQRKADRTPAEAGMKLLLTPYAPKERSLYLPDFDYALLT